MSQDKTVEGESGNMLQNSNYRPDLLLGISDDWMLFVVFHSVVKESKQFKFRLHMTMKEKPNMTATKAAKVIKQKVKQSLLRRETAGERNTVPKIFIKDRQR